MLRFLLIPLILLVEFGFGQSKPTDIWFWPSRCDSCKQNYVIKNDTAFNYDSQYAKLKNSNVELALNKALANNDKRLIAISGFSLIFPGLDNENGGSLNKFLGYEKQYGYKIIMGTSDVVNPKNPPIQKAAYDYGKKYNLLFLKRLGLSK